MRTFFLLLLLSVAWNAKAQQPEKPGAAQIFHKIQQLNFLGSALYLAAHPDDENTKLISYLTNDLKARTGYLSLTRGDGGQNLIGPELREQLGLIRTQELLAARRIDGGEQFFTRAKDFGYSKHPQETLRIWDEEEVLKDVVWIIRKFRPDIIINRFHHDSHGSTHGHHTSSAILSLEAFDLAGRPDAFTQQLKSVKVWQPAKVFFNTSPWFYGSQRAFDKADKTGLLRIDVGSYFPLLGLSNPEIAARSRSQHQSQGFGATGNRGTDLEYLELIKGIHQEGANNLFEGINTTWTRVKGGAAIGKLLMEVERGFDFKNPAASLPKLLEAYQLIAELEDDYWRTQKTAAIKEVIAACAGLFYESISNTPTAVPGEPISLQLEVINRSQFPIQLHAVEVQPQMQRLSIKQPLTFNQGWKESLSVDLPDSLSYTSPYWLREPGTHGMYQVAEQDLIGKPQAAPDLRVQYTFDFEGVPLTYSRAVTYKRNDPVKGETYRPFEVVPPISASFENQVMVFSSQASRKVEVTVSPSRADMKGILRLEHPEGWKVEPENHPFAFSENGNAQSFLFTVSPPESQTEGALKPVIKLEGHQKAFYSTRTVPIDYDHIPRQTLVLPSLVKVVKLEINTSGQCIGYIQGAGDVVPEGLRQMGYQVDLLSAGSVTAGQLSRYDAVVLGIRAFNVLPELKHKHNELFTYIHNGGNLIVQYNTSGGLLTDVIAPYPLQLSRNRVADETAEVRFVDETHQVLNAPNKITEKDFEHWVQERGLYFAGQWSEAFTPILSMSDPGEQERLGSLLIAPYGEGHYIYTGLSFFREFPEGVPGAFRLFANLIAL